MTSCFFSMFVFGPGCGLTPILIAGTAAPKRMS